MGIELDGQVQVDESLFPLAGVGIDLSSPGSGQDLAGVVAKGFLKVVEPLLGAVSPEVEMASESIGIAVARVKCVKISIIGYVGNNKSFRLISTGRTN